MYTPFRRLIYLLTVLILCYYIETVARVHDCTKAKQEWMRLLYMSSLNNRVDSVPRVSDEATVCPVPTGSSCCDHQMEQNMLVLGARHLVGQASSNLLKVAEQMSNDSVALQQFFLSDLEQTQDRLHQLLSRIYGYNYKLHHHFFFQFFAELKAYVAGARDQLDHLIDNFFNQLRDTIVSLIERSGQIQTSSSFHGTNDVPADNSGSPIPENRVPPTGSSSAFDESVSNGAGETRRIHCLSERMAQLRPFDDVDVHLKAHVMEAYPPARMLVNVLSVTSRLIVHLIKQVGSRPECTVGMTRFRFCVLCAGKSLSSTCPESCEQLLSSCLNVDGPENTQLKVVWPRLIDSIVAASVRLERSFNFPAVNWHLPMNISEAITSLQTRYGQMKSKFQSECRLGYPGRSVPALFSSAGSINRPPHSSGQLTPMSAWPPSTGGFRGKLVVDSRRLRRSAPSVASPELLDWQTRFQPPTRNSADFGLRPRDYGTTHSPHAAFGQSIGGYRLHSNQGFSPNKLVSDPPEHLMRWAAQLKRSYSSLSTLFASPGSNFCSVPRMHPTAASINSTTECWNPPKLSKTQTDQGIKKTIQLFSLAAETLQLASRGNGDPETLTLLPPPTGQHPVDLRVASLTQSVSSSNEPFRSQASLPYSPQNQWNVDEQTGPYGSLEPRFEQEPLGSGLEPPSVDGEASYNSESQRLTSGVEQSQHASFGAVVDRAADTSREYGRYQPHVTSSANQWSVNGANSFDVAGDVDYREPIVTRETLQPLTEVVVVPTTPSIPRVISSVLSTTGTTSAATTESTTTTTNGATTVSSTPTTVMAPTSELSPTSTSTGNPPQLSSSFAGHSQGEDISASSTAPVHETRWHSNMAESQQPIYGGLPDDEDSVRSPEANNVLPQQSTTPSPPWSEQQPSWSGGAHPNPYQGNWWEDTYVEGSGFSTPDQLPFNKPGFGPPAQKPNQPDPGIPPPYFPSGSGQLPFQSPIERQPDGPPERTFENQPPRWPDPTFQGGVTPGTEWADVEPGKTIERTSDWQENFQGSGVPDPMKFMPTLAEPSPPTGTSPQTLINPPVVRTESPIYPPLPPPEVWVPAQIGPGQPISPILLVREYNLQGPLYRSESAPLQMDNGIPPRDIYGPKTLLLIAVLHCVLHTLY